MEKPEKKKPVKTFDRGRVHCAIWANETDRGVWFNVEITRRYNDGESWQNAASFSRDDLPHVLKVTDWAYEWIWSQNAQPNSSDPEL